MAPLIHIALVHHPIVDKQGDVAATSVTNLDIHDISRAGRTYGVDGFWIVHPYDHMHRYVKRVLEHWREGFGGTYNPSRRESLHVTELAHDLVEIAERLEGMYPDREQVWIATTAKSSSNPLTYKELRRWLANDADDRVYVVLFGTGWGLHNDVLEEMDYTLEPVKGPTDWNHLSVRAAAGIILDRILGIDR